MTAYVTAEDKVKWLLHHHLLHKQLHCTPCCTAEGATEHHAFDFLNLPSQQGPNQPAPAGGNTTGPGGTTSGFPLPIRQSALMLSGSAWSGALVPIHGARRLWAWRSGSILLGWSIGLCLWLGRGGLLHWQSQTWNVLLALKGGGKLSIGQSLHDIAYIQCSCSNDTIFIKFMLRLKVLLMLNFSPTFLLPASHLLQTPK